MDNRFYAVGGPSFWDGPLGKALSYMGRATVNSANAQVGLPDMPAAPAPTFGPGGSALAPARLSVPPTFGPGGPLAPGSIPMPNVPSYGSTPITIGPGGVPMPQPRPFSAHAGPVPMPRPRPAAAPWINPDQNFYNGPGGSSFGAGDAAPGMGAPSQNSNVGGLLQGLFR